MGARTRIRRWLRVVGIVAATILGSIVLLCLLLRRHGLTRHQHQAVGFVDVRRIIQGVSQRSFGKGEHASTAGCHLAGSIGHRAGELLVAGRFEMHPVAQPGVAPVQRLGAQREGPDDPQPGLAGVGPPSFQFTAFGGGWIDFDNDGWLDLLVVNGAVTAIEAQMLAGDPLPLRQAAW
mgnify:CR=1 FL=1